MRQPCVKPLAQMMVVSALMVAPASAQWLQRSYDLQTGLNSVFLDVDPSPAQADLLFDGQPITAVWTWVRDPLVEGPPQCPDPNDSACIPTPNSGWQVWVPPLHPHRMVTNLRLIRGGHVYLIEASEPLTWSVTGEPDGSRTRWRQGFNLVGFHVLDDVAATPSFADYLAPSQAHSSASVFEVQTDGTVSPIGDLVNTKITPKRGFWVRSASDTSYDGPVAIDNGSLRGIDFGKGVEQHSLTLENLAASTRELILTRLPSGPVPPLPADLPTLAGDVPMSWLDYGEGGVPEEILQWRPLSTELFLLDADGEPGNRTSVRLGVRRAGLAGAVLDSGGHGSQYQGLLTITDGHGYERVLPVAAQVMSTMTRRGGVVTGHPGLYLGHVAVDHVAWVTAGARQWANPADFDCGCRDELCTNSGAPCTNDAECGCPEPDLTTVGQCVGGDNAGEGCSSDGDCLPAGTCVQDVDAASLRPTSSEFLFPIIVHLSETGDYKLLTETTLMWEPGDEQLGIPGRYVLVTPECPQPVLDELQAGSLQDGQPFARRVSTVAFGFDGDLPLSGDFATTLAGQTTLETNQRLNPFHHKYHPDHDCDNVGECFEISRAFSLAFSGDPPPGSSQPGWGDSVLGGTYTETLTGLHKHPVNVSGRFELRRVSSISTLNAQ